MKNKKGIIYIYVNKLSGLKYIGQTVDFNNRQKVHLTSKNNNYFDNSLQKNGLENFEVWKSINEMSIEDMNFWEETLIDLYPTLFPNGYNLLPGGNNHSCNEETKKLISKIRIEKGLAKGENNPMYNKHHTEEVKNIISKKIIEKFKNKENHPMYGKRHSEKTKKVQSEKKKGIFLGKNSTFSIKIICLNSKEIFDCINDIERLYHINLHIFPQYVKDKEIMRVKMRMEKN